ncbi:Serine/threonine protein kinase [Stygiomarasmius scandens]|uniref:Serine/threonine protein kinase n=1 Tax=Marasmiellus scandens TaxID=2682957 RepID=A0ABR1JBY3_9AGAR
MDSIWLRETVGFISPGKELGFGKRPYSTAKNDVWALGILFLNLATGKDVWEIVTDSGFKTFLDDPMSLFRNYSIFRRRL